MWTLETEIHKTYGITGIANKIWILTAQSKEAVPLLSLSLSLSVSLSRFVLT